MLAASLALGSHHKRSEGNKTESEKAGRPISSSGLGMGASTCMRMHAHTHTRTHAHKREGRREEEEALVVAVTSPANKDQIKRRRIERKEGTCKTDMQMSPISHHGLVPCFTGFSRKR